MEILLKMTTFLAWIAVIVCPIFIIITFIAQKNYDGSLNESIDALNGYKINYVKHNFKALIIFIIELAYLLALYVL